MMDSIPGGSTDEEVCFTRKTLIDYYRECQSQDDEDRMKYLFAKVKVALRTIHLRDEIELSLRKMISTYKSKLVLSHRNFNRCVNKKSNQSWFNDYISFPVASPVQKVCGALGGRPKKSFEESSDRSKRRKTENVRNVLEPVELAYAAQVEYRACGDIETSKLIKEAIYPDHSKSSKTAEPHAKLSPDKALSLLIEAQLTKFQFNIMRSSAMEVNCDLYPNYETITEAKKRCYPTGIIILETSAEVPLQSLLDHTIKRLLLSLQEVISTLPREELKNLCLVSKWGCDGSGSHSEYKQKFANSDETDSYMFITSLVPIQLTCPIEHNQTKLVWQNPRPSSPRYCRPIKLMMAKETTELSKITSESVKAQIDALNASNIKMEEEVISVTHKLNMTMVDGKLINAITGTTSAMRCYLCGITSKDFNRIQFCVSKPIKEENLCFGISSLHAWIRFAEFVLHLGYRMKIGKWQARGEKDKTTIANEKQRIQKEFWQQLGLHVDKPRQGGGTSTDGNTARAIFNHTEEVAKITGVHINIINQLKVILRVMASGHYINIEKFKKYCLKTAAKIVKLYPWYYMPTSIHKILVHGYRIIETAETAIGLLSEDAQESRNKDVRKYRERFSRKFSRQMSMEDTFHRLMVSSDPHISNLRKLVPKKCISMCPVVLSLLNEPQVSSEE